jgi:osmotically-inducible protein OsmY
MGTRNTFAPTLRSWIVAGTVGTSLALLFDGERGERRRARLRSGGRSVYRGVKQRLNRQSRIASDSVYGNARERLKMYQPDNPNPDDNTLRDRIESEAFRHDTAPPGEYNLNVEDGIAVLRGQLNSQEDIQLLIELVAEVPDVRGVESYLHTPGTPAPNKQSAIEASDEAAGA